MGWEAQGRQYHGCFGNGTSALDTAPTPPEVARAVADGAARLLPPAMRSKLTDFVARDKGERLTRSIEIWTASADLPPAVFRERLVGRAMSPVAAGSMQAMAQSLAAGPSAENLSAAGAHFAEALRASGPDTLRYDLRWAEDQAAYAATQGLVPDAPAPVVPVQPPRSRRRCRA